MKPSHKYPIARALAAASALLLIASASQAELVAHYKFDEGSGTTAADSATADGAQDAATNQGTVEWTTGIIGGALDLPGNASMQALDAIGAGATAFTISAWVNMDDTPGYDGIFETRPENWGLNVNSLPMGAGEAFDYRFDNDPGGGSVGIDSPPGSATVDNWHHIAMVWTASGTNLAYLDGVETASTTDPGIAKMYTAGGQMWNIGDDTCCSGRELNAQLDDLAVWNEALSASAIGRIYEGGLVGIDAPTALVPEPSSGLLALLLLAGAAVMRRRRS